uniref:U4/U6.U5 small nuclear ribonucleoprotein 27 kDa protein n=1 Tax=Sinocyclocheilus grahami TaxID=75366 RepID=A0A672RBR1_SINGR
MLSRLILTFSLHVSVKSPPQKCQTTEVKWDVNAFHSDITVLRTDPESEDMQGKTEEEIEMMKLMGFGAFDSTKGKKKEGSNAAFAFNVSQKRKYRQYMNRKGGFNRPLDFIA